MAITREIPQQEWRGFLPTFSECNQGRPVRLETTVAPGEGTPVLAEHQPLLGVEFESKGSEAPAIIVTLGALNANSPDFNHVIKEPTHLWLEELTNGGTLSIGIESKDEGRTLLTLEQEEALPG